MPLYLGIDQSLTSSGFVVIDTDVPAGCVVRLQITAGASEKMDPVRRLVYIRDKLNDVLDTYKVERATMEGYAYGTTVGRVFELGELGGVLRVALYDRRIPLNVVAPASLKKYVTGKSHASKDLMASMLEQEFGWKFSCDDLYDAAGLAHIAAVLGGSLPLGMKRNRIEVVKELNTKNKGTKDANV